jgi:hypothetical protein
MSRPGTFKPGQAPHNKGKRSPQTETTRLIRGLSGMNGFAEGLKDLDISILMSGEEDLEYWAKKAREIARALNKFATKLKKGMSDAAAERAEHESNQSQSEGSDGPPDCAASPLAATGEPPG